MTKRTKTVFMVLGASCVCILAGCGAKQEPEKPPSTVSAQASVPEPAATAEAPTQVEQAVEAVQEAIAGGWQLYVEKDEMTGEESVSAIHEETMGVTTIETTVVCDAASESAKFGAGISVTTIDGMLITDTTRNGMTYSEGRIDTGNGEVRPVRLIQDPQYRNKFYAIHQENLIGLIVGTSLGAGVGQEVAIQMKGDTTRFKMEVELDNGTKVVIKGDQILDAYTIPCRFKESTVSQEAAEETAAAETAAAQEDETTPQ